MELVKPSSRLTAAGVSNGMRAALGCVELQIGKLPGSKMYDEQRPKRSPEQHLHWVLEKWFAPSQLGSAHPTRKGRIVPSGERYVCVEANSGNGIVEIVFFCGQNREWSVLPPRSALSPIEH
jgi:hypothetical protein